MKILHITPSYKPAFVYGGPTLSVSQLCEHQVSIGEDVTVITTTANGKTELPKGQRTMEGVKIYYFKRITKDHTHLSPSLLLFLWKVCKQYDVIHIHSWWNLVSVLATLVCWARNIYPIVSPRGMMSRFSFTDQNSLKKQMIHRLGGQYLLAKTFLHATSQLEWNDAHEVNAQWRGFILPNIIDLPEDKFDRVFSSGKLKIVFLSRIHSKKGLDLLLRALGTVTFPFRLEIYGDGDEEYLKSLRRLIKELDIELSVIWKGWVQGEAKYLALSGGDIFALTSHNENFANVVLESLAVGTPVLISDQVGMCEYVRQTGAGWVCESSIKSISNALNEAYAKRSKVVVNINQVYNDFDGKNISRQYIREYQQHGKASSVDCHYSYI